MPGGNTVFTAAQIRRRFATTKRPVDPGRAALPVGAEYLPAAMRERMSGPLIPAAVLMPIIEREAELTVLLTERSADLKLHAGQVSFPGGRMEAADGDVCGTALRETHEEVGIRPDLVEIAGFLDTTATVTGYAVTPVIGLVNPEIELVLDPLEVRTAFEVPLQFLLDRANAEHGMRYFEGLEIPMVSFQYQDQRIWGATASMLISFRNFLLR
jgi:8-oxo-dGTP pyrophosphatase MutT (NUDIX family)